MTLIYGTHGTSKSFAEDISEKGFDSTKLSPGRHGKGVYLWSYNDASPNTRERAVRLGKAWHSFCFGKKFYDECPKKSCVVLDCKADVELLDLVDHENASTFQAFLEQASDRIERGRYSGRKIDEQKATKLYGLFVSMKGQQDNKKYNAVHVLTSSPIKEKMFSWQKFAQVNLDSCYVINDTKVVDVMHSITVP